MFLNRQHQLLLGSRPADSICRQAQRELEEEKVLNDEYKYVLYFGNRQVYKFIFLLFTLFYTLNYIQVRIESSSIVDYSKLFFKCSEIFGDHVYFIKLLLVKYYVKMNKSNA